MLLIFPSGTFFCFKDACGINFWGVHGHDAIWHLAIANVSFNKFPFIAPTFSGENLYGYNYLFDFFIFLLTKIGTPAIISYFKLLPVLWFISFTILLIIFSRKIKDDPLFVSLFLFFSYFAGSFSYFLTLYHDHTINGSSTLLPQPIMHMMSNLPYAFSILFFLWLLILMIENKFTFRNSIMAGICIFLILGMKFYGGVISIFMLGVYLTLCQLFTNTKKFFINMSIVGIFVILGILFFYNPFQSLKTGAIFGFAPLALIHPITETPNQFYLQSMTDARYYLLAHGGIGPRLIAIELLNILIFLIFYLGTRFFAFFYLIFLLIKRKANKFDIAVVSSIFFSIILTSTLVQKAQWWNTIQFFFYAIFLLTIYLTRLAYDLINKKNIFLTVIVFFLMLASIPTSYDLLRLFLVAPGATYVSEEETKALDFLKKQSYGVVLTPYYNKMWKNYVKSNEIYTYDDTAYIPAFSEKPTYFNDLVQLQLTGIPYEQRLKKIQDMDCSILKEVNYVYEIRKLPDSDKILIKCKSSNFKNIYSNGSIIIYSK